MLDRIEAAAERSVGRACGFAALGVGCMMVGLSGEALRLALDVGGFFMLLASLVLVIKAWTAPFQPYKRTEVWHMLGVDDRPQAAVAQKVIGGVLREVYLRFAMRTALLTAGLLGLSLALSLVMGGSSS